MIGRFGARVKSPRGLPAAGLCCQAAPHGDDLSRHALAYRAGRRLSMHVSRFRKGLAAFGAVGGAALLAASLYSSAVCACLSVAETMLKARSPQLSGDALQRVAQTRFPAGLTEAELIKDLGMRSYARYCLQGGGGRALVCLFPHDVNFWRDTHIQLSLAFDAERRVRAVRAERIVRVLR